MGRVYFFRRSGGEWRRELRTRASEADDSIFGASVALRGDVAAVGQIRGLHDGRRTGVVFVYRDRGGGWTSTAKLVPVFGAGDSYEFGTSVSTDGIRIAVGASAGFHVFRSEAGGWIEEARIERPLTFSKAGSIAIDGDTLVVGDLVDDELGNFSGAAFVYEYDGDDWIEVQKLLPSAPVPFGDFGSSVAISNGVILIGSHSADAFLFEKIGEVWSETRRFERPREAYGFGRGVAIDGDRIVIGADEAELNPRGAGAAYVYERTGNDWKRVRRLQPAETARSALFGRAVGISGESVIVGAYRESVGIPEDRANEDAEDGSGAAYIFED